MPSRILTKVGEWTSNVGSAAINRHYSRHTSGIMEGILNECPFISSGQNGVVLGTGNILIEGHIIEVFEPISFIFSSFPQQTELWQLVVEVQQGEIMEAAGDRSRDIEHRFFAQAKTALIQQDLFANQAAVYQLEVGTFNVNPNNTVSNVNRTMRVIMPEISTFNSVFDYSTTNITYTLRNETDKTFAAPGITNVNIVFPATITHGFISAVNFASSAVPPAVALTNNSAFPLKTIFLGMNVVTYTPSPNKTVNTMAYCDGINVSFIIQEV